MKRLFLTQCVIACGLIAGVGALLPVCFQQSGLDMPERAIETVIEGDGVLYRAIAISPDGRRVCIATSSKQLDVYDVQTRERVARISPDVSLGEVAFSPNGRFLLGLSHDSDVYLWSTSTWKTFTDNAPMLDRTKASWESALLWHNLASPNSIEQWHIRGDGKPEMLAKTALPEKCVSFDLSDITGHGRYAVYRDGELTSWLRSDNMWKRRGSVTLTSNARFIKHISGGDQLLFVTAERLVAQMNTETGAIRECRLLPKQAMTAFAVSPDEKCFAVAGCPIGEDIAGRIAVYETSTGDLVYERDCDGVVFNIAFGPKYLAAFSVLHEGESSNADKNSSHLVLIDIEKSAK